VVGTTSGPSDDESLAARAFAALTSSELEPGEDGRPDRADWKIVLDERDAGVLEVSRATDGRWHELRRLLERLPNEQVVAESPVRLPVVAEGVTSSCWAVVARPESRLNELTTALSRGLPLVEAAGIDRFFERGGRTADVPPLNDEARHLLAMGVVSARPVDAARDHADHVPRIFVFVGLPGGSLDPALMLNQAVEDLCASNANKLACIGESHLWLWVDEGTYLGGVLSIGWMEKYLTSARPLLPNWVTKVWLARERSDEDGAELSAHRIWSCEPGGTWKLEAESV
jgi:hypothetical protein